jgi:protein tyrosine phosphatase
LLIPLPAIESQASEAIIVHCDPGCGSASAFLRASSK